MQTERSLYRQTRIRQCFVLLGLCGGVLVLALLSLCRGASGLTVSQVLCALFGKGAETEVLIVRQIRLQRAAAAILAGIGLGTAGCVMQNVLRNPMASPSTLGVSNAAVFGANFAIVVLGAGSLRVGTGALLPVCAFVCAVGTVLLLLVLSARIGFRPEVLVLAGVAAGFFFSAGTTLLQFFAAENQLSTAVFWTFGDLGRAGVRENLVLLGAVGISCTYFYIKRWDYNVLAQGEDVAQSLGVRTGRVRFWSLLFASVLCAVCVSFLGIIGFVGLIAPQAMRRLIGTDFRFLLPASGLLGAVLLLASDLLGRSVMAGVSLPVGAITSLFGAPLFLVLLLRKGGVRGC